MKARFFRLLALGMALLACPGLAACVGSTENPSAETEGNCETKSDTDFELPTEAETEAEKLPEAEELSVRWHFGYVASAAHASTPSQVVKNGNRYSYTDVFTVEKAGTTVTFVDNNEDSNGDSNFASASVYVFSSWKQKNGEWVLDTEGFNYGGSTSVTGSPIVEAYNGTSVSYTYTTTNDNEHLRICFRSGETATFSPEYYPVVTLRHTGNKGTGTEREELKAWIEATKKDAYYNVLEGLTVNAIGDSYFAGQGIASEYIWINLLAQKYGMSMNNYGIGGSTISAFDTSKNPMCHRYYKMESNNAQIILLEGGRNDYNVQAPIGEDGSNSAKNFIGGLNITIDGIRARFPNAMLVLISPWNFPEGKAITREDYVGAMRRVAEAQGIAFIDASDAEAMGVDMCSKAFRAQYSLSSTDVSHLNPEGMKLVMPKFEQRLAQLYADFLAKKQTRVGS